jgi:phosphatidylglycerol---prolipoprotein diacylglyceryl transferase
MFALKAKARNAENNPLLSPRLLSLIFLIVGVLLFLILFHPISLVFSGQWKLHQQIELFNLNNLTLGSPDWIINIDNNPIVLYAQIPVGLVTIRFYSILILLGVLSGYALSLYLAKQQHIAGTIVDRLLIGLLVFGLIGARLFFVAFNWDFFSISPLNILLGLTQGGLSIYGAIIGSFLYLWYYTSKFRFNLFEFLDFISPGLLLGQVIGRWGNFFNYEAYGPATSVYWKMFVPETTNITDNINDKYFHPTFLYEIIPNFILLVIILYNYQLLTKKHAGRVFAVYAIGYGIIRFVTEFYRLDALKMQLPFTIRIGIFESDFLYVSQFLSLILIFIAVLVYWQRSKIVFLKKKHGRAEILKTILMKN